MEAQQQRPVRSTRLFWVGLSITVVLTLGLAGLIIWLLVTQNLAQHAVIVGLIASIVAIVSTPLIFYVTIFHKPEQRALPISPHTQEPEPPQAHPSEAIWTVPYRRNPIFTGREDLLQQLYEQLHTSRAATLTQPQAISGLGGIGKTQLAIEYAYRHREEYRSVLWVNAASRDTIISSFLDLASRLQLPEREEQDQSRVVAAVKAWCATNDGWLLIFDNADELPLIEDYLPPDGNGHLLLTTRDQAPGTLAHAIEVEPLDLKQGMLFLLRRANVLQREQSLEQASVADRTAAEAIVRAMDGLPLALEQAGAYIEETRCSLASYRDQFQQRQARLLSWRGRTESKRYPHSVATTWALSFERVETLDPLAAELLRFCAFLAPDAIPEWLIIDGASELGPAFQPLRENPAALDEAIATLGRYSLLKRKRDEQSLSVHRLVQAVLKQSLDEQTQRTWAERTVKAVNQAFPDVADYRNWPRCQQLLPHAQACFEYIDQWHLAFAEAGSLCNDAGYYLDDRAQYPEAAAWYQRAIAIDEKVLGPEDPGLAADLNNLAILYEQAEPLYQRAMAIDEKALGPAHPNTITHQKNYQAFLEQRSSHSPLD